MRGLSVVLLGALACTPATRETNAEAPAVAALFAGSTPFTQHDGFTVRNVRLPARATGDITIGSSRVRALGVADVPGALDRGAVVYRNVAPSTDAMWIARPNGIEELRVLRDDRAAPFARWSFGGDVRVDDGTIVVATGLRSARLFAIDANGTRRDVTVRAIDTRTVEAHFDPRGLAYPIVLDPLWTASYTMGTSHAEPLAVQLTNGDVLVHSRENPASEVWELKSETFVPTAGPARQESTLVAVSGSRALLIGGGLTSGATVKTVDLFDGVARTWSTTAPLSNTRRCVSAVVLDTGDVLAIGGAVGYTTTAATNTVELWSATSGTWSARAPMKTARCNAGAARLASGKVLVAGGRDAATEHKTAEIYDPVADTWTAATSFTTPASDVPMVALPGGGAMYGVGSKAQTYELASGTWTAAVPAEVGLLAGMAVLKNGSVLSTGGAFMGTKSSAELFDPATSKWTKTTPMPLPRLGHAIVALADGRALIIGGGSGSGAPYTTAELFVPMPNGETCTVSGECATGFCTDGVCCDKACKGACSACNLTGTVGTCSPVTGPPAGTRTCAPYKLCAAGACDATCKEDLDCAPGSYCDGTACQIRKAAAAACTRPRECLSNYCADGFCCNTACDETCEACDIAGKIGTCTPTVGAPHGTTKKCPDVGEDICAARTCNGIATAGCFGIGAKAGTECKVEACAADRFYKPSTCDGAGTCKDDVGTSCSPFACAKGGCLTACTTNTECAEGFACREGKCAIRGANCTSDQRSSIDETGKVISCNGFRCGPAGTCLSACGATDECADGFVCDTASKKCTGGAGSDDGGCSMGHRGSGGLSWIAVMILGAALARRRLALALFASGAACARETSAIDPAREIVAALSQLPETAPGFSSQALIARDDGFALSGPDQLSARLPRAAGEPLWMKGVAIAPPRSSVPARVVGNAVVFADVEPGRDLVYTATPNRVEEIWIVRRTTPKISVHEELSLPSGWSARIRGATIEIVAGDVVQLASEQVIAIDAKGVRRAAQLTLAGNALSIEVDASDLTAPVVVDPAWGLTAAMSTRRYQHTATKLTDGSVLVAGGSSDTLPNAIPFSTAERFSLTTKTWSTTGSMATPRRTAAAVLLGSGKVLVAGGFTGDGSVRTFLSSAELYDPASGTWSAAGAMTSTRDAFAMIAIPKGALAFGRGGADVYDASTNTWTATGPMVVTRMFNGASAATLPGGKILVAGGAPGTTRTSTAEIYDPATNAWSATGSLSMERINHDAWTLASGKIVVMGGLDQYGAPVRFGEIYDDTTKVWTKTTTSAEAHPNPKSVLLDPGRIFLVGGAVSAEVWSVASDTWAASTAPLIIHSSWPTLTALSPGVALYAGGTTPMGITSTAELFESVAAAGACVRDGDCTSGFCRDGVCCNTACIGSCVACDVPGLAGTCSPVTGAPHAPRTGCGTYACAAGKCGTTCTDDAGCSKTAFCDTDKCVNRKDDGRACTRDSMCASGHCVDGVCCNTTCTDLCAACDVAGRQGECSPVAGLPHGTRKCDDGGGDVCKARRCNGTIDTKTCVAYASVVTTCASAKCEGSQYTPAPTCDGKGGCGTTAPVSCSPYKCNDKGCRAKCSAPEDCVTGYECDAERCVPTIKRAHCTADGLGSIGIDDVTHQCGAYRCGTNGVCSAKCAGTADCAPGFICDSANGACTTNAPNEGGSDDGGCQYSPSAAANADVIVGLLALLGVLRRRRRFRHGARHPGKHRVLVEK